MQKPAKAANTPNLTAERPSGNHGKAAAMVGDGLAHEASKGRDSLEWSASFWRKRRGKTFSGTI